jgi:hypothetical protein
MELGSLQERTDLDLAEEDLGALGLKENFARGPGGPGRGVDEHVVEQDGDRGTVADDFHPVPFAVGPGGVEGSSKPERVLGSPPG